MSGTSTITIGGQVLSHDSVIASVVTGAESVAAADACAAKHGYTRLEGVYARGASICAVDGMVVHVGSERRLYLRGPPGASASHACAPGGPPHLPGGPPPLPGGPPPPRPAPSFAPAAKDERRRLVCKQPVSALAWTGAIFVSPSDPILRLAEHVRVSPGPAHGPGTRADDKSLVVRALSDSKVALASAALNKYQRAQLGASEGDAVTLEPIDLRTLPAATVLFVEVETLDKAWPAELEAPREPGPPPPAPPCDQLLDSTALARSWLGAFFDTPDALHRALKLDPLDTDFATKAAASVTAFARESWTEAARVVVATRRLRAESIAELVNPALVSRIASVGLQWPLQLPRCHVLVTVVSMQVAGGRHGVWPHAVVTSDTDLRVVVH